MATFKAYLSGGSCGVAGGRAPCTWDEDCCNDDDCCAQPGRTLCCEHGPSKRGQITGWSAASVRRHTRWLYSVDVTQLDGAGDGVTLTLRDVPTDVEWVRLVKIFLQRIDRLPGLLRWHAVVEWQRRGAPHLHLAVYCAEPISDTGERWGPGPEVVSIWREVAGQYGVSLDAQFVTPISGPLGWLQYLSKHAARGVRHYQRWGRPAGWETTGRLWRHSRAGWPVVEPVCGEVTVEQMWRLRRMVRAYAVASARADALRYQRAGQVGKARGAWRRVAHLRRAGKDPERGRSAVRGVSEWVPAAVLLPMAALAGWDGTLKEALL